MLLSMLGMMEIMTTVSPMSSEIATTMRDRFSLKKERRNCRKAMIKPKKPRSCPALELLTNTATVVKKRMDSQMEGMIPRSACLRDFNQTARAAGQLRLRKEAELAW